MACCHDGLVIETWFESAIVCCHLKFTADLRFEEKRKALRSDEIEAVRRLYWCRSTAPTVAEKHTRRETNDGLDETAYGPLEIGAYVF